MSRSSWALFNWSCVWVNYQPVKAELDKQAKEADDAQKAAQENVKELTQAQNELKTAQDTANKAA